MHKYFCISIAFTVSYIFVGIVMKPAPVRRFTSRALSSGEPPTLIGTTWILCWVDHNAGTDRYGQTGI